ncbi:hypothetical protein [Stenotrophomonas maltophilia]|uniref:hypothetical protein n=1 Tax=Stenotrophomonas maltophilia TaxID=40324 RepID=UPI0021C6F957|nr:hypothetical protein [Stenotrophomonas maltophilia]MCU1067191.1 hypothetical protein [Stenotrophomonas maltophilia]MCU1076599.1 hypothetical protein [Stenotrophomonas maltophilia]MCU1139181.1 hypothetical protein [Stenotrophomonas maltophilia]
MHPEIEVKLTASAAGCASYDLMAQLSREVNEVDAADVLIRNVIDCRGAASLAEPTHQALEVDVRVRIGEGARACLNLSSVTVEKMASIFASLNFDPELAGDGGADGLELEEESAPSTRPELVVVLVGDSPVSGEEVILSRVERQQYRTGDIQGGVHEALQRGLEKVEGKAKLWALQVGVRLSSQRGVWPGFNLSCDVIRLMASGGVSLDFDPYV